MINFNNLDEKNININKILIGKRFFNTSIELVYKKEDCFEWLIRVREICCDILIIEFDMDHNYIIKNFIFKNKENKLCENGCLNLVSFEGKNVIDFIN